MPWNHKRLDEIKTRYKDRQYISQQCVLCGWTSNGLTFDEADAANMKHQESHPEWEEYQACIGDMGELLDEIHANHECNSGPCTCICGCREEMGCRVVIGPLCSVCVIRANRGDSAHGMEDEEGSAEPAHNESGTHRV